MGRRLMAGAAVLYQLADVRPQAAIALQPDDGDDITVLEDIVDSLMPPALMLGWNDPWLQAQVPGGLRTMGPCLYSARLTVACVAARLEPGTGVDELERLVAYVLGRMGSAFGPLENVTAPRQTDQGGVSSLVAEITYAVPTTV
jgi:hypothetical protein